MSIKRFVPILAILCVMAITLFIPTTVHAQSTQATRATYSDTYAFNAGWWGWGICLGHNETQSIHDASDVKDVLVALGAFKFAGPMYGLVAASAWLYAGSVASQDRGRGICMAWPYYLPSPVPIIWSR